MKVLQRSDRRASLTAVSIVAMTFSLLFSPVNASSEYLCLTARGNSMYPTILNGDHVEVQLKVEGGSINIGDILVYSTIATHVYAMYTRYMWIGHRVIEKYTKDGVWCFRTKGDNCAEPDSWEVPEYWLLGVVVSINHTEYSQEPEESPTRTDQPYTQQPSTPPLQELETLIFIGEAILMLIGFSRIVKEVRLQPPKPKARISRRQKTASSQA